MKAVLEWSTQGSLLVLIAVKKWDSVFKTATLSKYDSSFSMICIHEINMNFI